MILRLCVLSSWQENWFLLLACRRFRGRILQLCVGLSWFAAVFKFLWKLFYFLEKAMAPHSSTHAWKIPWTGEPGRLLSMGSHRVGHDWSDLASVAAAVWSPFSPRDSQESSSIPQFKSINSSVLSFIQGPTLTSMYDYWKNQSFYYMDLCWQRDTSAFQYAVYVCQSFSS